ncbi:MAG: hypothetical protein N4A35_06965 [Flavobacteriales bacterium]|jgi:hypothetical protein|nr:hypothetical protein [Flavobacteriales bacterium]
MRLSGQKRKRIALYFLVSFVFQMIYPSVSLALTGGPSQPEVSSFEPIGTTQMVDLYTGDFTYNIPLMNVPGSNGSYPINIAYHGGVGMEDEASWVGLGWNINPGAIVRQMRGLPDDFDGDLIEKEFSIKPDYTIGIDFNRAKEFVGAEVPKSYKKSYPASLGLYYNSYRGVGYNLGINFTDIMRKSLGGDKSGKSLVGGVGVRFDSQGGMSAQPSFGLESVGTKADHNISLGATLHSTQGFREVGLNWSRKTEKTLTIKRGRHKGKKSRFNHHVGAGATFSHTGYVPRVQFPMQSHSYALGINAGKTAAMTLLKRGLTISYTTTHVKEKSQTARAYGFLHQENAEGIEGAVMDFNREKDGAITKESPYTPLPVQNHDIYAIQGQGTGGAFRAFRSDIGHLKDVVAKSTGVTVSGKAEWGMGDGIALGADISGGYSVAYSGPWKNKNDAISSIQKYKATDNNTDQPKYEKFYFKPNGELTATQLNEMDRVQNEAAVAFDLGLHWEGVGMKPKVKNAQDGNALALSNRKERSKRNQHIEYFTKAELNRGANYPGRNHHIHKMVVRNPDGNRYEYGEPAYNKKQKDVSFSVLKPIGSDTSDIKLAAYVPNEDNSVENKRGRDHFFSSTTLPEYAHAYMLTAIKSNDYVDITGDGVTADDFGFWTKFEYETVANYKWRFPYEENKANYVRGNYSDAKDDKGAYIYGEKDLKYLTKVETNTHVAEFHLSNRNDGVAVKGENGGRGTIKQKKLDSITLYSKADLTQAIQQVHFEYDYSLCEGIPSSTNEEGKLTLKKIYYSHLDNTKGELTPYEFRYGSANADNPDYSVYAVDRWGNYQPETVSENPYTRQDNASNTNAGAWALKEIDLPSGSTIKVSYENDDYQYVQNKRAMQMCEVIGTSKTNVAEKNSQKLTKEFRRLYFKTPHPLQSDAEVYDYIKGIESLYFKVFVEIKNGASDYITGYAPVSKSVGSYGKADTNVGYLTLETINYKGKKGNGFKANPIQFAGWQYLRYERPDLNMYVPGGVTNIIGGALKIIEESLTIFTGYYNKCKVKGYANTISEYGDCKSYLRLNTVKNKLGGGYRVKKVEIHSLWEGETAIYGQEYQYQLKDGTSSGVAEYEPLTGGDEISLRVPQYYAKKQNILIKNQDFKEEPYGESYFPGAKVGYSRVVVKNLTNTSVTKAQTGIAVSEFYTAKDFPVVVKKAHETVKHKGFNLPVTIPFVGSHAFQNNGYSNGYSILVNDMPGKPKANATYSYSQNPDYGGVPVSSTEYTYQTKTATDKEGNLVNVLDNKVQVLDAHGVKRWAKIGETYDFYIDQSQHSSYSMIGGIKLNLNVTVPIPIPIPILTAFPDFNSSQSMYRHVITNKVIYRNAVLKSVKNNTDGAVVTATNELYDAESGQVLLTTSNNEHEAPVYNYTYPAHWAYPTMGGAYKNYRMTFELAVDATTGDYQFANNLAVVNHLNLGDQLMNTANTNQVAWVTEINTLNNTFKAEQKNGTAASFSANDILTVIESGNKNMQSIANGNIVSLNEDFNNVGGAITAMVEFINEAGDQAYNTAWNYEDSCNQFSWFKDGYGTNPNQIGYSLDDSTVVFEFVTPINPNTQTSLTAYDFDVSSMYYHQGHYYIMVRNNNSSHTDYGNTYLLKLITHPFVKCPIKVLQASATEFCDTCWTYDYSDVGATDLSSNAYNSYAYGKKGIWRALRSWVHQAGRAQSGSLGNNTRIDVDGQFDFFPFDWYEGLNNQNHNWVWSSEMTKYSPYGYQLESKNPLGIYSSELYGYNNTVVTAVGANAKYEEIAFDGFEYGNVLTNATNNIYTHSKQGHLFDCEVSSYDAHTGDFGLLVQGAVTYIPDVNLKVGKKYLVSAWAQTDVNNGPLPIEVMDANNNTLATGQVNGDFKQVDNWTKIEVVFTATTNTIKLKMGSGFVSLYDDLRISPYEGGMQTYVYHPTTLWLAAELDQLNYATFYNYDEEGQLVQVKKETDQGIVTVQQTRSNTKR